MKSKSVLTYCMIAFLMMSFGSCEKSADRNLKLEFGSQTPKIGLENLEIINAFQIKAKPEFFIGSVTKILCKNDKYYILDRLAKQVVIIDQAGNVLNVIKSVGKGPYEYLELSDMCLDGDRLAIFDNMGGQVIIYDLSGNALSGFKTAIKNGYIGCINSHYVISKGRYVIGSYENELHQIGVFDDQGKNVKWYLPFGTRFDSWLSYGNEVTPYQGSLLVTETFDYHIYRINKSFDLDVFATIDFGTNSMDTSGINKMSDLNQIREGKNEKKVISIGNIFGMDDALVIWTMCGGRPYISCLDLKSGHTKSYRSPGYSVIGFSNTYPIPRPIGDNGSELIGCVEPDDLLKIDDSQSLQLSGGKSFKIDNKDMQVIVIFKIK